MPGHAPQQPQQQPVVAPSIPVASLISNQPAPRRKSTKQSTKEPPPCKWFARGTCKFGAECRFPHTAAVNLEASLQAKTVSQDSIVMDSDDAASISDMFTQAETESIPPKPRDSDVSTLSMALSSGDESLKVCQIVWCDQRAFKETSETNVFKAQLEARAGPSVKAHKTAEKCIRLLQKKQHWRDKPQAQPPRVFLVSWANAPVLVPYLTQSLSPTSKVVVLCDQCRSRGLDAANGWAKQFAIVDKVATSWEEAIEAVALAVVTLQSPS